MEADIWKIDGNTVYFFNQLRGLQFAIAWESDAVAASLFDLVNPADPKLLRRVSLGTPGTYSEALWDEKARKVLPAARI